MARAGVGRIVADRVPATQTKPTTQSTEARRDAVVASRAPTQTLLPIRQANTFQPGVPASLAPPPLLSATGRSDGPRGVGGQNNNSTSGGSGPLTTTTTDPAPVAQTPARSKPAPTPPKKMSLKTVSIEKY